MSNSNVAEMSGNMSYVFIDEAGTVTAAPAHAKSTYRRWGKRLIDVVSVLLVLPTVFPVILVAVLLTRRDGGKGLFHQNRVGRDGQIFRCWKIRTMIPDADAELIKLIENDPDVAAEWRVSQKLENDPRITALGRLFRRTSIDELPQLWNVLIGDMSLIGPRPFTPAQKAVYDDFAGDAAYYEMRPGISGLWQVECRNSGQFSDRIAYDNGYADRLTLWTDFSIVLKTLIAVFRATGK